MTFCPVLGVLFLVTPHLKKTSKVFTSYVLVQCTLYSPITFFKVVFYILENVFHQYQLMVILHNSITFETMQKAYVDWIFFVISPQSEVDT